ncbi:MAG: oligopeptide/dipeptide ABC transporter ATP-binding protein [Chloracidobacterium sp.]|uniref:ABC transporter ATP-binding protein n=1 Tax=Chloracidobacterium validum TaxID=2821543 RepID=UPI001FE902B8|nr:oligopeptide/dipeptide ABC transporter ATP-binding protein [Chloracidobacterium validum]
MNTPARPLLQVEQLVKHFPVSGGVVKAVDDVSFTLHPGETFGLVGESGCGKTTIGRAILRLIEPSGGRVVFDGRDLLRLRPAELRQARRDMQIVFQDPYASLNPRMRIGDAIAEPLVIHGIGDKASRRERVAELLRVVGLDPDYATRYPHEFSGGQRQRIGIARALALEPKFIVADEPVSALDVSVQAQVINLLADLREQFGLTYLFISHGLAVVEHFCAQVGTMYLGKLVEVAPTRQLFTQPRHPYTQALLDSIPIPDPTRRKPHAPLAGDVPSPLAPPPGCRFHPRCPIAVEECRHQAPPLRDVGNGHHVACWLAS